MIGLQPLLTTIDVMKEQIDENEITLRPFYTAGVFRWAGIPLMRNRIYAVIHLSPSPRTSLKCTCSANRTL
jgi:hypothetical protein